MAVKKCFCVELSPNKKSIPWLRTSLILYTLVIISFLATTCDADMDSSCTEVRSIFEKKGMLSAVDIQEQPNSDAGELCLNRGCCGPAARARLSQQARGQLEAALRSELGKLADVLNNRAKRFDDFFRKLLQISREGFHTMFKRTYGMIYEQHSYVFEQLFEQLERYYTFGDTNFELMMDHFFGILYQKMFSVLNSQYSFDEKYLSCVNEHMRDIQPFEDVPHKLSVQLRRAFVATRTFHKSLRAGADVVRNMMQVGVSGECVTAWARLRFCGGCGGAAAPACSRYCHNVLRGCLPAHADLTDQWDAYVDAVEKVADRLLGPFNIAMVVEPIDIKISEAIMSFQEHNQEISQKIFAGCGKPVLGGGGAAASGGPFFPPERTRRAVRSVPDFHWDQNQNDIDDFEIEASFESLLEDNPSLLSLRTPDGIRKATEEMAEQAKSREKFLQYMRGNINLFEYEEHERRKRAAEPERASGAGVDFRSYEFSGKRGSKKKKPTATADDNHGSEWAGPALEKLVRDTRVRVRASHHFWSHLPAVLCSPASVTTAPCFNGTHVASYTLSPAGEGSAAMASNPEVRGAGAAAGPVASSPARAQLEALRTLTARLKDAYNGLEVQWKDSGDAVAAETVEQEFMEPGSGSGSGDDADDGRGPPDDDEDRDLSPDYPEGSGEGRLDEVEPEMESQPSATGTPLLPSLVNSPGSNNVRIGGRVEEAPLPPPPARPDTPPTPARDSPVTGAADRPSLQKALFTYALPVVCAWFGTILTDLI